MASPGQRSADAPLTAINVTPLVDVMLVLLVIFMVTAKLGDEHAVPLELPKAASGAEVQHTLTIALDERGRRFVDGVAVQDDRALEQAARRAQAEHAELRTVISAATRASHGDVLHVLDRLRLIGITKVAFAVEPSP